MTTTRASVEQAVPVEPGPAGPASVDREFTVKARSQRQQIVRRFLHNKVGMSGLVIFVVLVLFGLLGPLVYRVDYATQNVRAQSVPPGTKGYPLGSDESGRDLLAGLIQGMRRSPITAFFPLVTPLP